MPVGNKLSAWSGKVNRADSPGRREMGTEIGELGVAPTFGLTFPVSEVHAPKARRAVGEETCRRPGWSVA